MNMPRHAIALACGLLFWNMAAAQSARSGNAWCAAPLPVASGQSHALLASLEANKNRPPSPLPRLHTEGTLPHQGIYDESVAAKRDLPLMQDAALAWRFNRDPRWLAFAHRYLMAWATTYQPSFNPIDETGLDALIETFAIIQPTLLPKERQQLRQYLHDWADGYLRTIRDHTDHRGIWTNNWQSHRVKLVTLMAVALDDKKLFAQARELYQAQIAANIDGAGEALDFKQRDALHYVVYDLQPLTQAALAARRMGEDWYHWQAADGASLASAVAWLTPYVDGRKTHAEFVHSQVRFDAIRAQAGLQGFSGPFDPRKAATLYWLLTELDPALRPLAMQLGNQPRFLLFCAS